MADKARGEEGHEQLPHRPNVANVAIWLWYGAVALYVIIAITGSERSEEMRLDPAQAITDLIKQLIVCALLLIPVRAFARGRDWGRVLLTCVGALVTLIIASAVIPYINHLEPLGAVLIIALILTIVCAVIASFHTQTNRWVAMCRPLHQ